MNPRNIFWARCTQLSVLTKSQMNNGIIQSDTNSIVHFLEGVVLCQNKQSITIHLARIL